MGRILTLLYEDLLEFHRKAMKYFKQKSKFVVGSL